MIPENRCLRGDDYVSMKALRNEQLMNLLVNAIFVAPNEGKDIQQNADFQHLTI